MVDEEVEQAVVVVIPEPGGEIEAVSFDSECSGHVVELAIPVVMEQAAPADVIGDEKVDAAVPVVIAPGRTLGAKLGGHAGCGGDIDEGTIAQVMVKPAPAVRLWPDRSGADHVREILAADKQVDMTVVVVVAPRG